MSERKYNVNMTEGRILPAMLSFAVPLMFSSVLQLLFNAADVVVVGRFSGENSLAAVGSTATLINLLTNLFLGLSVGANVTVARFHGARLEADLSKAVHTTMTLSVISGVIMTFVGFFGAHWMLSLMQTPPEVIDLATDYLQIYFLGVTAMMVYNFGAAILRAVGDTKRPLYYLLVSGVLNVILNLVFVIGFKMDVSGVALATVMSEVLSAVLVVMCLMREGGGIRLDLKKLGIDKAKLISIISIGLPAGFQGVLFSLSNVVIQSSVNGFGNIVVAGNSAAQNIEGFVYVAMNSFHQAAISFTGQNYGAGRYDRISKVAGCALGCVTVTGVVLGWGAFFLATPLLSIYSNNPDVIAAGTIRLSLVSATYALCGFMDVLVGVLRGIGRSILPMAISLVCICGFRLLWLGTVFQQPEFHVIRMVYMSYPVSWILAIAAMLICYFIEKRKLDRMALQAEG